MPRPISARSEELVLAALSDTPQTCTEIARRLERTASLVLGVLSRLVESGQAIREQVLRGDTYHLGYRKAG